jgi:hypothetical protein
MAGNQSEKLHKRRTHKTMRAMESQVLADFEEGDEVHMPQKPRDAINPWSGDKDGKTSIGSVADFLKWGYTEAEAIKARRKFMGK